MIEDRPTVNHSARIRGSRIRWIVLHADASPSEPGTIGWILNPRSEVSYHRYIRRDGRTIRFVPDHRSAWACGRPGKSAWGGVNGINSWTLNLAFANRNDHTEPLTQAQIDTAHGIIREWKMRHADIEDLITHAMSATPAGRKHDPEWAPNFRLENFR